MNLFSPKCAAHPPSLPLTLFSFLILSETRLSMPSTRRTRKTASNSRGKQAKFTDLGKSTTKMGASREVKHMGIGVEESKKKQTATKITPRARTAGIHQENLSDTDIMLRQFDLNYDYGPCCGLTRLERWERAKNLGLNPPPEVREALEKGARNTSILNDLVPLCSNAPVGPEQ
ncbi:DNA polymerase delta, subunit 4-domain-containing protein [Dichotomocladium elegans]|nr:DNA polymerase delta, subunit 4-domain-containing protein [Dichotomocladium elegans]